MSGDSSEAKRFAVVAETRRRWSAGEKRAIVEECSAGQASESAVARKHNIAPNLLFRWRKDFGADRHKAHPSPTFVPVALPAPVARSGDGADEGRGGLIEIELLGGRRLRVDGGVDAGALRRVIEVLEGR
jgi:transposase